VGNDAGDLDSVVSAMALSYWLDTPGQRYLPAASFPRQDFKLRQDAALLFAHSGLPCGADAAPTNLLHWGELTPEALGRWPGIGVALTDHNKVAVEVAGTLGARTTVAAVVDHHNDERAASTLSSPLRVIDAAAGSTCSLLAELMPNEALEDPTVCALMLGVIAVDCRGFDPALLNIKYSIRDMQACTRLLSALGSATAFPEKVTPEILRDTPLPARAGVQGAKSMRELCDVLLEARYDVAARTPSELLRLDYKQATSEGGRVVGVAAVCISAPELLARANGPAGLEEALSLAAAERGVDVLFAMTAEDLDDAGQRKSLFAAAGTRAADSSAAAETLLGALSGIPDLPPHLATQALFVVQDIATQGFGLDWAALTPAAKLKGSTLRALATRKTLLPALLHFSDSQPS